MQEHIVLDIESTSLNPNCCILSLAFVPVPRGTVEDWEIIKSQMSFYRTIDLQSCKNAGFVMSAENFYWWLSRNEKARFHLANGIKEPIIKILRKVEDYLNEFDNYYIWSHKDFDAAALRTAYRKLDMQEPFEKEQLMDLRTLNFRTDKNIDIEKDSPKHVAINDALHEAKIVKEALGI